jgi:hypothetical protein
MLLAVALMALAVWLTTKLDSYENPIFIPGCALIGAASGGAVGLVVNRLKLGILLGTVGWLAAAILR